MKLSKSMQNHLGKIELDPKQLAQLNSMQQELVVNKQPANLLTKKIALSLVATMVLIITITFFAMQKSMPQEYWIAQIADEVAKNHLTPKPLEVVSNQILDVQNYFTKLDFLPISSQIFNQQLSKKLTGGRYCSIEGSRAAQLRFVEDKYNHTTLFQTNYTGEFSDKLKLHDNSTPITTYARGVEITIWQEKGLLMVTAKNKKQLP